MNKTLGTTPLADRQVEAVAPGHAPLALSPGAATSVLIERRLKASGESGRPATPRRQQPPHKTRQRDVLQTKGLTAADIPLTLVDDTRHTDPDNEGRSPGGLTAEVVGSARAQGLDGAPDLLSQPVSVRATLLGHRPLQGGDDTPPTISNNRGDAIGTDVDPDGDDTLLTVEALGKVSGTSHVFSVLGGGAASPQDHRPTQRRD